MKHPLQSAIESNLQTASRSTSPPINQVGTARCAVRAAFSGAIVLPHAAAGGQIPRCAVRAVPQGGSAIVPPAVPAGTAFTLIEMIVVVAVIGGLAVLLLTAMKGIDRTKKISVAQAELSEIQVAIDSYKKQVGVYPPDNALAATTNAVNFLINPLYFELAGTVFNPTNNTYTTLDGSSSIGAAPFTFTAVYSPSGPATTISGFMNSSTSARGTDDKPGPLNCIKGFRPNQIGQLAISNQTNNMLLVCSIIWPNTASEPIPASPAGIAAADGLNPWRYVSSNPTNNPNSYDLWVDLLIAGQTNRVSNWSKQPQIVH